jgi:hypothetical protein
MSLATPIYGAGRDPNNASSSAERASLGRSKGHSAAGARATRKSGGAARPSGNAGSWHLAAPETGALRQRQPAYRIFFLVFGGCIFLYLLMGPWSTVAAESAAEVQFATHARHVYEQARKEHAAQPASSGLACKFARACFDWAEFATNSTERAELAEQGISACHEVIARDPKSAAAHYYLAMNLGQLARTRGLSALRLVNEMEKEFLLASSLDEHLDFAGPDRNLGMLYRDAPSFGSIGSRGKARKHLIRAAELAPEYPENRLSLMESDIHWNDLNSARHELKLLEEILPRARTNLAGEDWASSWADWNPRLEEARKKIEAPPKSLDAHKRN